MDSNTTRPEHYKSASEAGKPFLLKLHPFSDEDFETQCHLILEKLHWHNDAYLFQAAAYLWRLGKKDSITQDLEKALWYLERREYVGIDLPGWAQPVSGINAIAAIEEYLAGIKPNEQ